MYLTIRRNEINVITIRMNIYPIERKRHLINE